MSFILTMRNLNVEYDGMIPASPSRFILTMRNLNQGNQVKLNAMRCVLY